MLYSAKDQSGKQSILITLKSPNIIYNKVSPASSRPIKLFFILKFRIVLMI